MIDYTHRDRRAQRDVDRALLLLAVAIGILTAVALWVPFRFVGLAVVVALGVLGAAYVAWSEGMLATYANDLRLAREGGAADGFRRAEVASPVGLDRDDDRTRIPSPHSRRRSPQGGPDDGGRGRGAR